MYLLKLAFPLSFSLLTLAVLAGNQCYSQTDEGAYSPLDITVAKKLLDGCRIISRELGDHKIDFRDSAQVLVEATENQPEKSLSYTVDATFASKGEKIHRSYASPFIDEGKLVPQIRRNTYVFDGKLTTRDGNFKSNGNANIVHVSSNPQEAKVACAGPVSALGFTQITSAIEQLVKGTELSQEMEFKSQQLADGYKVRVLTKSKDWVVAKFEEIDGVTVPVSLELILGGTVQFSSSVKEFVSFNGLPFPAKVRAISGASEKPTTTHDIEVYSYTSDPGKIEDSIFALEIPKDTFVFDMDIGRTLRSPSIIESHLNSMRGIRIFSASRSPLLIANVLLFFFIACICLYRKLAGVSSGKSEVLDEANLAGK